MVWRNNLANVGYVSFERLSVNGRLVAASLGLRTRGVRAATSKGLVGCGKRQVCAKGCEGFFDKSVRS